MQTANFELLKSYFRLGDLPTELTILHRLVFAATYEIFRGAVPESWREIYGPKMGTDLQLPAFSAPVAVEDDLSCVMLWNSAPDGQTGIGTQIGYLQAQRMDLGGVIIIPFGAESDVNRIYDMVAAWKQCIKLDWGILMDLHYEPSYGPLGNVAAIVPIATYYVDPNTGQRAYERRNAELLNDMCGRLPEWRPLPEAQRPYFDELYSRETKRAVVQAIHEYALLRK